MTTYRFAGFALSLIVATFASAQGKPGEGLPTLIRSNEQLGTRLLNSMHMASPDQNVAIAPPPITLMFALFRADAREETDKILGWDSALDLRYSSRMFIGALDSGPSDPPKPEKLLGNQSLMPAGEDSIWMANAIVYRTPKVKEVFAPYFVRNSQRFYHLDFVNIGDRKPQSEDLRQATRGLALATLPAFDIGNDFAYVGSLHLSCSWQGNLFVLNPEIDGDFAVRSGGTKPVHMMDGEKDFFDHAQTDEFEAITLPCSIGSMTVVMPAQEKSIEDLSQKIVSNPSLVSAALHREFGAVVMPSFDFAFHSELRPVLERYGFKSLFGVMRQIILVPESHLTEVNQSGRIRADRAGVYAEASTLGGGILGGIMGGPTPFHMVVNRPFLFFVHDDAANILLFAGVVMDPTQN
ncbi:proteinase inhibitor I4, serpin [Candidatus Koribacter versatilis Ellin345]|uniref:Proteinase inhibitor I4, serpin n=1 Tax=Koribacter versatilis (strain Ellin345) TaxID=204669 RepID=Q1ITJ4_KORVE|nr:serpin family protein [Candidatus Koribacter versatilis]ABF39806.1 proteinase inhibitor I4, serpin [Candidatus Koribacter versatilis Ellin345]